MPCSFSRTSNSWLGFTSTSYFKSKRPKSAWWYSTGFLTSPLGLMCGSKSRRIFLQVRTNVDSNNHFLSACPLNRGLFSEHDPIICSNSFRNSLKLAGLHSCGSGPKVVVEQVGDNFRIFDYQFENIISNKTVKIDAIQNCNLCQTEIPSTRPANSSLVVRK